MKTIEKPIDSADPVILEVREIKRQINAEHGGDLQSFFAGIRARQSINPRLKKLSKGEQGVVPNP